MEHATDMRGFKKILALDFDGCIVDSVIEALFITYVSYRRHINRRTKIFDNQEVRVDDFLNLISHYQSQVKEFSQYRPYIKDASDYAVILHIIENNLKVNSEQEFFQIKELIPQQALEKYYRCFYDIRAKAIRDNFDAWTRLTPPFSCIDSIRELAGRYKTLIVTTNAKEHIVDLLAEPYLNLNIKEEDIVDLHISTDKVIQMKYITEKYRVKFEGIHFVDDNLNHLLATQPLGVNVYLAGWGYCTQQQRISARERGITLLTERNICSVLNDALEEP